jgi:hypothetical protein
VCEKLKDIYFSDQKWVDCYRDVSAKLNELKIKACKFYAHLTLLDVMKELTRYRKEDIVEIMNSKVGDLLINAA